MEETKLTNQEKIDLERVSLEKDKFKQDKKKLLVEKRKLVAETEKIISEKIKILKEVDDLEKMNVLRSLDYHTMINLQKMSVLSNIMVRVYSQDSNLGQNKLFSEEELYPYKAKMLELLKQL
jgi:hypothetical protein